MTDEMQCVTSCHIIGVFVESMPGNRALPTVWIMSPLHHVWVCKGFRTAGSLKPMQSSCSARVVHLEPDNALGRVETAAYCYTRQPGIGNDSNLS
jgi:hypothetical protein